jgi:hypothetical protein
MKKLKLSDFQNRVFRKMFESRRKEITGHWKRLKG